MCRDGRTNLPLLARKDLIPEAIDPDPFPLVCHRREAVPVCLVPRSISISKFIHSSRVELSSPSLSLPAMRLVPSANRKPACVTPYTRKRRTGQLPALECCGWSRAKKACISVWERSNFCILVQAVFSVPFTLLSLRNPSHRDTKGLQSQ